MKRFELPSLDYGYGDLAPAISEEIMRLHHDKHHLAYVKGANAAMEKLEKSRKGELEINTREVLRDFSFHANGHILHSIFWKNMKPYDESNSPGGEIEEALVKNFGSVEAFKKEFSSSAKSVEGVGWALLAKDEEQNLYVLNIEKHNLMHVATFTPILVLDVWEHAFYLDYKNDKASYVQRWWNVVNWDDVEKRFNK